MFEGFGAPKVALRFTSGIGGVPELGSAEAYVEFEKNVSAEEAEGEPRETQILRRFNSGRSRVYETAYCSRCYE